MANTNYKWFNEKIGAKRLSQAGLARLIGLDPSTLSLLLHGKRRMRIEQAADIARILGVSVDDVMRHAGADMRGTQRSEAPPDDDPQQVPLVGWIDGESRAAVDWTRTQSLFEVQSAFPADAVCLQFRTAQTPGDLQDGWLCVTLPPRQPEPQAMLDRFCVVGLKGGGGNHVRIVRRGYSRDRYTLLAQGQEPIHDAELAWFSPVLAILPV